MTYTEADRERWVAEDPAHKRADRDDFARDRARLVHSASLRRLSAKTQVVQPTQRRLRAQPAHPLPRGRPDRPRVRCGAGLQTPTSSTPPASPTTSATRRSGTTARPRSTPSRPASAASRATPRRCACSPAWSPSAPTPTAARPGSTSPGPASTPPRSTRGGRGRAPHRRTMKFGVYDDDLPRSSTGSASGAPDGHRCLEAQVMDWPTTSPTPCTTSRTPSRPAGSTRASCASAADVEAVLAVAGEVYEPGLTPRRARRAPSTGCSPPAPCPTPTTAPASRWRRSRT